MYDSKDTLAEFGKVFFFCFHLEPRPHLSNLSSVGMPTPALWLSLHCWGLDKSLRNRFYFWTEGVCIICTAGLLFFSYGLLAYRQLSTLDRCCLNTPPYFAILCCLVIAPTYYWPICLIGRSSLIKIDVANIFDHCYTWDIDHDWNPFLIVICSYGICLFLLTSFFIFFI